MDRGTWGKENRWQTDIYTAGVLWVLLATALLSMKSALWVSRWWRGLSVHSPDQGWRATVIHLKQKGNRRPNCMTCATMLCLNVNVSFEDQQFNNLGKNSLLSCKTLKAYVWKKLNCRCSHEGPARAAALEDTKKCAQYFHVKVWNCRVVSWNFHVKTSNYHDISWNFHVIS